MERRDPVTRRVLSAERGPDPGPGERGVALQGLARRGEVRVPPKGVGECGDFGAFCL